MAKPKSVETPVEQPKSALLIALEERVANEQIMTPVYEKTGADLGDNIDAQIKRRTGQFGEFLTADLHVEGKTFNVRLHSSSAITKEGPSKVSVADFKARDGQKFVPVGRIRTFAY